MSKRDFEDEFDDRELIDAEFQSMVEGLSLDESAPTTFLDELDALSNHKKFTPPHIPKRSLMDQLRDAVRAITQWKNNSSNDFPEDGAAL